MNNLYGFYKEQNNINYKESKPNRRKKDIKGSKLEFLYRKKTKKTLKKYKTKQTLHIWTGSDTACHLYSTGGIKNKKAYKVIAHNNGHQVCKMCLVNNDKQKLLIRNELDNDLIKSCPF